MFQPGRLQSGQGRIEGDRQSPGGARLASGGSRRAGSPPGGRPTPPALRSGALFTDFLEASVVRGQGRALGAARGHPPQRPQPRPTGIDPEEKCGWVDPEESGDKTDKGHQYFTGQEPRRFLPQVTYLSDAPVLSGCFFWVNLWLFSGRRFLS